MKHIAVLAMVIFLVLPAISCAENNLFTGELDATLTFSGPQWIISITDDGQLEINGKAIDKMSDPEIKETMLKLRDWLISQEQDRSLIYQYGWQTRNLLTKLDVCQQISKDFERVAKECIAEFSAYVKKQEMGWEIVAEGLKEIDKILTKGGVK